MFPLFAPDSYREEGGAREGRCEDAPKPHLRKKSFQIHVMNYFLPKSWLQQEKLIAASLIVSLHNNKLNRRLSRHHCGFVFLQR